MSGSAPSKTSERKRNEQAAKPAQESGHRHTSFGPDADILELQRVAGNRAVGQMLQESKDDSVAGGNGVSSTVQSAPSMIQTKLTVNQPGDKYEQEADRVAELVMRVPAPKVAGLSNRATSVQRKCTECASGNGLCPKCAEEKSLQRQPLAATAAPLVQRQIELSEERKEQLLQTTESPGVLPQVSPRIAAKISAFRGKGRALPASAQAFFEPRYGMDFSGVRVHTDSNAAEAAGAVRARAFTVGPDVVFGEGEYAPETNEGKRLLAHELAHVVQQKMQPLQATIQREPITPDWQYEADRLTTEELDSEIQAMRAYLLSQTESSEASKQTRERLAVFEQTLIRRERRRIRLREAVGQAREAQRGRLETTAGEPLSTIDEYFRTQQSAEALFVLGFINGYITEIPPGELRDYENEMREHWPEFVGGYMRGLPVGLWNGLTGLVEGIWTLVRIGFRFTPQGIRYTLNEQAFEFARDPAAYIEQRRRQYVQLRAIAHALQEFGEEFRADPTIVIQWSSDLGLALGQELANRTTRDYLRQSPHDKGYLVGDIAGQIVFEVLLEIILAVATKGIGNLLQGVAAVGQAARAGGRVANLIRRLLEASPALRRLLRAISGAEDISDVARLGERGASGVKRGGTTARTTEKVGETTSGAGKVAEEISPPHTPEAASSVPPQTTAPTATRSVTQPQAVEPLEPHPVDLPAAEGPSLELDPNLRGRNEPLEPHPVDLPAAEGPRSRGRRDEIRKRAKAQESEASATTRLSFQETRDITRRIHENEDRIRRAMRGDQEAGDLQELLAERVRLRDRAFDLHDERRLAGMDWRRARRLGTTAEQEYFDRVTAAASRRRGGGYEAVRKRGRPVFRTDSADLSVEHVVPRSRIAEMPGWEKLSWDQHVELFDWEPNLRLMPKSANSSRGNRRFADWQGWRDFTNDEDAIRKLITDEESLERDIQNKINTMLGRPHI